jgi:hypothetical protein
MSRKHMKRSGNLARRSVLAVATTVASLATAGVAAAQTFNSGSTGADGAFDLTGTPSGTVVDFNPKVLHVNKDPNAPLIDPEHDNVFHFTTITVPANVTVMMSAKWTNGPVYWLASGAVNIGGTVYLGGENAYDHTRTTVNRIVAVPGPGGFPGGLGGNHGGGVSGTAKTGAGAGGGLGSRVPGGHSDSGFGGTNTASPFLVPLLGGSGGGGGSSGEFEFWGGGGGAGGGALLIASSTSVNLTGSIDAQGGHGGRGNGPTHCTSYRGGGGAGGSVRMVAPVLQGNGRLYMVQGAAAAWGCSRPWDGTAGRVRLEAFQHNWSYTQPYGERTSGSPLNSFAPSTPPPFIQVTGVAGQAVRPDPTGAFDVADVTINSDPDDAVEVTIQARYVPLQSGGTSTVPPVATVPKVTIFSLEGADLTVDATPLAGTFEQSTSTVMIKFPPGFTRGYVRAVWSPTE